MADAKSAPHKKGSWTNKEERKATAMRRGNAPIKDIAQKLGRTSGSIAAFFCRNNIYRGSHTKNGGGRWRTWSAAEEALAEIRVRQKLSLTYDPTQIEEKLHEIRRISQSAPEWTRAQTDAWFSENASPTRAKAGASNFSACRIWTFTCRKDLGGCGFEWQSTFHEVRCSGGRCQGCSDRYWKETYVHRVTRELLRSGCTTLRGKYSWPVRGEVREILNEEGHKLQLDIFIGGPNAAAAIEVQGRQHYEEVAFWGGAAGLARRRRNDERKRQECARLGITLWEIDLRDFRGSIKKVKRGLRECVAEFLRGTGLV